MRARQFAPLLLLCVSLTGCGGAGEPEGRNSPPPTAADIAYHDCLEKQGVAIVHTEYGAPRIDKTKPWNAAAVQACESMLPPPPSPEPVGAESLAAARKESACLRAEGVAWYPDPNPVTGEVEQKDATQEQWADFKVKHVEALRKCKQHR